ncbi:MAG: 50S ribosomal protein L4 [candidate division SR1 bacterium CG_4_9_14_3_um_filter_40_9]|nr:MAG: 50S ribosomal protein L4 [candidate division SR1 bacterium CG_4_9_14_3_um_filter_40_9]
MAYSIDMYDKSGKVVGQVSCNEAVFNDELVNPSLIHEYYLLQTSNARNNIACVKGKGEVQGTGKKMYKQKGTGGARAGGRRSPSRVGGGVAFGPRGIENYVKDMPKKAKKIALNGLLTLKAKDKELCGLKDVKFAGPKTKEAATIIKNMGLANKKVLFVIDAKDENITKSFRNLPKVKYLLVDYLNPYDLMHSDKVVFLESAFKKINK